MFGFQQRANMETNKGNDWLEAIAISNYKTMWLAHGSQVIDHMTRNKEKGKARLVSGTLPRLRIFLCFSLFLLP
jgi:hypothetical protein